MARHDEPFPFDCCFCGQLSDIWTRGLLDEYSDSHFLIRALYQDNDYCNRILSTNGYNREENIAINFTLNMNSRLGRLYQLFDVNSIDEFIKGQLAAGKQNYDEKAFFQALSEIHAICLFGTFLGTGAVVSSVYEPRLNNTSRNPEAQFRYSDGVTLNVEVKTPTIKGWNGQDKYVKPFVPLTQQGREELKEYCSMHGVFYQDPDILKFKDYINSAGSKFPEINDNQVNLLCVDWNSTDTRINGILEPISILCNDSSGLFRNKETALFFGITEEHLKKISAIIVYYLSLPEVLTGDLRYLFANDSSFAIIANPFAETSDEQLISQVVRRRIIGKDSHPECFIGMFNFPSKNTYCESINELERIINNAIM